MVTEMVARFAAMLDVSPTGFDGCRRPLTEHLTCPVCGAHHTEAIGNSTPGVKDVVERPTHQCRDCAHQWVRSLLRPGLRSS
jgi:hypothetical protein